MKLDENNIFFPTLWGLCWVGLTIWWYCKGYGFLAGLGCGLWIATQASEIEKRLKARRISK